MSGSGIHILNREGLLKVIFTYTRKEHPQHDSNMCSHIEVGSGYTRYIYEGSKALDILLQYEDLDFAQRHEHLMFYNTRFNRFWYTKLDPQAVPPYKSLPSDAGYDLQLIRKHQSIGRVTVYGTGISVCPPTGFYFELIARAGLISTGYMLANSVGVIDQSYKGEVLVPLLRVDESAGELSLPMGWLVQMIPRRWYGFVPHMREQP